MKLYRIKLPNRLQKLVFLDIKSVDSCVYSLLDFALRVRYSIFSTGILTSKTYQNIVKLERIVHYLLRESMENLELYIIIIATLMLLSVFASKLSDHFGVPALLIFLGVGMLAGSDGLLGIHFEDAKVAQSVGTIALIFILFGGGLDTSWKSIKPVIKEGLLLATIGVILTALLTALCVRFLLEFSWLESLLLGAIISSTDAAAVFAILRAKGIALKKRLAPLLELESGSNDPMAIFLTVAVLQMILLPESSSVLEWIGKFFLQFVVGGAMGYLFGVLLPPILNRIHLSFYGLYPVFSIAWVLLLFSASSFLGGNGFLAVYIAGIAANAREFVHKKNLIGFHDGIAWIMQITVFLTLGLLVYPSELPSIAPVAMLIALWLMIVARPIGVMVTLKLSPLSLREKSFISWVGLRGAVPIVLATYPFLEELESSVLIFNTVFFIVLTSVLIQGTTLPKMAKLMGVSEHKEEVESTPIIASPLMQHTLKQFYIPQYSNAIDKSIAELELPHEFLILLIRRGEENIKPTGSTLFSEGDMLLIKCEEPTIFRQALRVFEPEEQI